jgi:transposase-like protein
MDEAEPDSLPLSLSKAPGLQGLHIPAPAQRHSTNPLERLNGEIKRRTEDVGIVPNEAAITRLVGAILFEQNDEWAVQRDRYITWKASPNRR